LHNFHNQTLIHEKSTKEYVRIIFLKLQHCVIQIVSMHVILEYMHEWWKCVPIKGKCT